MPALLGSLPQVGQHAMLSSVICGVGRLGISVKGLSKQLQLHRGRQEARQYEKPCGAGIHIASVLNSQFAADKGSSSKPGCPTTVKTGQLPMVCLPKLLFPACCVSRAWERSASSDLAPVLLLPLLQKYFACSPNRPALEG